MRTISLWQPWASGIALGLKTYETRGWSTKVRGPVAIHAAKRWTPDVRSAASGMADRFAIAELADPPRGAIVAIAELTEVHPTENLREDLSEIELAFGNYADGRFAWSLENVRALEEPIPFRGGQGFFSVPDELIGSSRFVKPLNSGSQSL